MGQNLTRKILADHLVSGELKPAQEIAIEIDQILIQDATGTLAWLEFEALGIPRVRADLCVTYVDHNMLQTGFENADDHFFLQRMCAKYGAVYSRPGNGISHQAHLERFVVPGQTLLGADSHTPTAGALAMLAIGTGSSEVAVAMAGQPYHLILPKVYRVELLGQLGPWVSAKDVILELLRRLTVKGAVGAVMEYGGPGLETLTVPQRATVANMGAELGATSSIFPSDERAREFLRAQKREEVWRHLSADDDADYDNYIEVNLSELEPLIAKPSSPDNVVPVREIEGTPVKQVCVGSSVNSSYVDLMTIAEVIHGRHVHPDIHLVVSPGSRQVLQMVIESGGMAELVRAGARGLEVACGPCIGMGQAPPTGGASVRTFNRNFPGRSGTPNDQVYLCSPEVAAATALYGVISDPRKLDDPPKIDLPKEFIIDDSMFLWPPEQPPEGPVPRGPNIESLPTLEVIADTIKGEVLLKVGDDVSTDEILPAGNRVLPYRSNIPKIAQFLFEGIDPQFHQRAREKGGGIIIGGHNYGQGSSREHAAVAPRYLGVRAVLAKSYARIHHTNLVNFGILPLVFAGEADYDRINAGDLLEIPDVRDAVRSGEVTVRNTTQGYEFIARHNLSERQVEVLLEGGLLNHVKARAG
ncbi:MAG: aconitate hydratase [Thermoanaerobaculia bacterium]